MIKHIVMWRLKDADERDLRRDQVEGILARLRTALPGILTLEVGADESRSSDSGDLLLYCEFANRDALKAYDAHPLHQELKQLIGPLRSERRLVDYETGR